MLFRIADALRGALQHDLGRRGEDLAHRYLRKRKFVIVARNYRPETGGHGEIDIIARQDERLVFVEVKTRSTDRVSFPERAVDTDKRKYLIRTALDYARRARVSRQDIRFDVIAITGVRRPRIEHFEGAFEMTID